jgi:hypothetical protein
MLGGHCLLPVNGADYVNFAKNTALEVLWLSRSQDDAAVGVCLNFRRPTRCSTRESCSTE